nr:hypothetical protein [Tanacetum cinerariifolium]
MWEFKDCSSNEALYTKSYVCSKGGFIDKFVCDPNKTPNSSQRPPQDCPKCENPVDGLYYRHCALLRKTLKEHKFSKDFLNTSESSNDNSNVNMPQDPIVFNKGPGENSSQSPPYIDHHCSYGCGDSLDDIFYQRCTCKSCENGAHHGYNCLPKVSIISNSEPCHDQNVEEFPQTLPSFHPTCYSGDENSLAYDSTPNLVNDSPNIFNPPSQPSMYSYEFYMDDAHYSYDCPPQFPFIYDLEPFDNFHPSQPVIDHLNLQQRINDSKIELYGTFQAWLRQQKDQVCHKIPLFYDDDDDEESSTPLRDIIISKLLPCITITPVLSTKETKDSLIMRDEHLDTIPENDDESFSDEEIPKEIYLNPLFDEEIISINIDPHHLNAESDLIESLLNQDSSAISSFKMDSLLDEFANELIFLKSILPGIDEADCDPKEEIHLIEKLLYDNSSPRHPKEFIFENSDAAIESFSPSPIPVEDSDSLMKEINLSLTSDDSMPPGIENDDYDSEGDILILEEFLSNDFLSLLENDSFRFDIPSSPLHPAKPSDDDEIDPNSGILTIKVVGDISEHYVLMPKLLPTQPTLASNEEKSPHLLSYQGLKACQLSSESPMMIYAGNIPILDVPFSISIPLDQL